MLKELIIFTVALLCSFMVKANLDSLDRVINSENFDNLDPKVQVNTLLNANLYQALISPRQAFKYTDKALEICDKYGNMEEDKVVTYIRIGITNYYLGNYELAVSSIKNSLRLSEFLENGELIALCQNNIANIYQDWGKYELAIEYYNQAIKYYQSTNNDALLSRVYTNVANTYEELEQFETALKYYNQSMAIKEELNDEWGMAKLQNNIGEMYYEWGNYNMALKYFEESLRLKEKIDNRVEAISTKTWIGRTYMSLNNLALAGKYLQESLEAAKASDLTNIYMTSCLHYSELQSRLKNYKKAYEYINEYYTLKDSVYSEQSKKELEKLQVEYEIQKNENEKLQLEKENEIKNLKIVKQRYLIEISVLTTVLLLVIIFVLLRRINRRKK